MLITGCGVGLVTPILALGIGLPVFDVQKHKQM